MARRFAKVSEEEIEEAFLLSILWVGEERWIYTSTLRVLRGIVVYYTVVHH